MKYKILPVTNFVQNCTIFRCEKTNEGVVIDPGGESANILQTIKELNVKIKYVLLTHGHIDHIGSAKIVADALGVEILGSQQSDEFLYNDGLLQQANMFYFPLENPTAFQPNKWLNDGDKVNFGEETLEVLLVPGHTPGHIAFYNKNAKILQCGDVLFKGSIGRTDFPGGNFETLINSINSKLFPLGDDVLVIPGHGEITTIADEKQFNPFLR